MNLNRSQLAQLLAILLCISIGKSFTSYTHRQRPCSRLFANEAHSCTRRGFVGACTAAAAAVTLTSSSSPATAIDKRTPLNSNQNPYREQSKPLSSQTISTAGDPTTFQESISGFISGTAVSAVKTIVKYPLDTATVRLQMPNTEYSLKNLSRLFEGSFDGISGPLLSNIPAGAIFFGVKDAVKTAIKSAGLPKWLSTSVAVAAALPPYWIIRNPSEVIKTRLQVGADGYYSDMTMMEAFQLALSQGNVTSLYQGFSENIIYGFPADVIKFVAYDYLSGGRKDLSPVRGAIYGAISTGVAQCVTTPLDVTRNRIMAEVNGDSGNAQDGYVARLVKIANEEGVGALFAGTTPRIAKAMLSGALQFAAYEETKQKITDMFNRR
jgi:solute carrier family 25 S-adenosylmethionine transporter 26